MYYDKRIRYVDYLENGEKRRNCGYVKITVTGGRLLLEMQIRGLYATDDVASEVMLEGTGTESRIGTVIIRQGSGNFRWEMQDPVHQGEEILLDEGLKFGNLERIAVHLSSHRSLCCMWREPEASVILEKPDEQGGAEAYIAPEAGEQSEWEEPAEPEPSAVQEVLPEPEELPRPEEPPVQSELPTGEELQTAEAQRKVPQEPPAMPMSEDKWQQLQRIYPHIRPFQDEREYLSLRPEDFVILHSNAYRLVQNSFLLHGFYNYKHLILTHVSQRNAGQYYIGVPGNFYEKEKQVAIMYGFDSFECREEPAGEGDFGYYMIRVEL